MKTVNMHIVLGNVTKDPTVKDVAGGAKVATFSLATNRKYKDNAGNMKEEVEYHNIVAWGGLADITEQYIRKGKPIHVIGYQKTRSWEDQESGKTMYRTETVAEDIILLGVKEA